MAISSFSDIVTITVTSSLISTVVGSAINAYRDATKDRTSSTSDALSAAVILEGYALHCASVLSDNKDAEDSDGYAGESIGNVPDLPSLPVSIGLFRRGVTLKIANRLAIFPQDVKRAAQEVTFLYNVDTDAARSTVVVNTARIALESLTLADALRSAFDLPPRDLVFDGFDVRRFLTETAARK